MYSSRMGNIINAVLSEGEIKYLWHGLKSLEKHGQDPSRVDIIDNGLLKKLIADIAKASNHYLDGRDPISEAECKERMEHCAKQVKLAAITKKRQQKEIDRIAKNFIARENRDGLGKISSEGIIEKDTVGYKTDMSHVQKVKKKKDKKKGKKK